MELLWLLFHIHGVLLTNFKFKVRGEGGREVEAEEEEKKKTVETEKWLIK